MSRIRRLHTEFLRRLLLVAFVAIAGTSILLVVGKIQSFYQQSSRLRAEYKAQRESLIQGEVERALVQVNHERRVMAVFLENELRERVDGAHSAAMGIYDRCRAVRGDDAVQAAIIAALREQRFLNGRGCFFVTGLDGTAYLWPTHPEREGTNVWDVEDGSGRFIVRDFARIARDKGAGFYRYAMAKPGVMGEQHEKIAFIKYFKPYNWCIGIGEYVEDFRRDVQKDVLDRLESIHLKYANYLFASSYEGVSLMGPAKGQNVLAGDNQQAREVVSRLIQKAREGGGFVEYLMPNIDGHSSRPKISYVMPVEDWDWYIGAGVYVDEIEGEIEELQARLRSEIVSTLGVVGLILLSVVGLAFVMARRLAASTRRSSLELFAMMERAAIADDPVDVTRFEFEEFRSFAESANHMLAARKKSEAQFRLLLENSPVATLISDLEGRARFVNNSFVSLFGYSLEEVSTAERWFQLAFPDESYRAELLDEWQRAFKDACDKDGLFGGKEVRIRCADGVERDVFVSASLYTDRLIVHFQDRTEQKHAEEILRQSQKMEAMGQLAGGVAHDFNNMLGGIIGAAELLKRRVPENPEATKYTSMILEAAGRAAGLTEKLLVFSRKQTVEAVPVDLHAILRDVVAILENSIDKRVAIELDLSANESVVVGDVAQLQAVFLNLGINAAHAMPEGGRLSFRTHALDLAEADRRLFELKPGRYIEVEVADTGSGIPPEILPRIFEPFFTTKEPGKGTGLGLSAAFGAVQQHGGSIKVYSDVGIGTCFRVLLPLTCDVGVRPTPVPAYFSGKGLVLVVDDEKIMRDTARALLEDVGYRVLLADDGCQALEVFRSRLGEIDWVILDMVMPCMNGKDCFFAMRSLQPDVRIVLSSGLIGGDDLDEMMAAGLTGVIRKPFRSAELYRALEGDREG